MKIQKAYLVPIFTLIGLILGAVLYFLVKSNIYSYVWMITLLIGTLPLLWKIFTDIFKGHFGVDIIAIVAIITSFILGEYLAGSVILLMLSGGEALEDYALKRARRELSNLISNAPTFAYIEKNGNLIEVKVEDIKVGDIILIKPGQTVAADGVVVKGESQLDESALTGEAIPVEKNIGSYVFSGSINRGSVLEVEVLKLASESKYEQIIKLIKQAEENRAPVVRLADKYSVWFTVITFVIAFLAWLISKDPIRMLSVLVVATPCPLILATPIAMISGISKAASRGIIVKNGGALETLAESKAFIFDKTGTLTLGHPEIFKILSFSEKKEDEIFNLAASLDQLSMHVLARSIKNRANDLNINLKIPDNFKEQFGFGVEGEINNNKLYFGKLKFIENQGINIKKEILDSHKNFQDDGKISVYLSNDKEILGAIVFADIIRPEIKNLFLDLRKTGVEHLVMLTGDKQKVAEVIAKELGVDDVHADALPEDKVYHVLDHKKQFGKVAMIGDGVNDAPALVTSDVGIALGGHGDSASSESGDIVIMVDNLLRVGEAYKISKKVIEIAKQGIFIGIGVSILLMIIASFGFIKPVYGALLQEALDVIVILNALRVLFYKFA